METLYSGKFFSELASDKVYFYTSPKTICYSDGNIWCAYNPKPLKVVYRTNNVSEMARQSRLSNTRAT